MADIHYYRILKTKEGAVFGEMSVRGVAFAAVENRSKGYDSLPSGTYQIQKDYKKSGEQEPQKKVPKVPCLRFIEVPGRKGVGSPFLIHRAKNDRWSTLAGCIAPGMDVRDARGTMNILDSEKAMGKILELLGEGKVFTISIDNDAPGDKWKKDEFIQRRQKRQRT